MNIPVCMHTSGKTLDGKDISHMSVKVLCVCLCISLLNDVNLYKNLQKN
jgi:hypothetical protein